MFNRVPGTKDILPGQIELWQSIEEISRRIFSVYNYQEIRPPLIEEAVLFNRSLGENTEVVQKQMFMINSDHDTYVLRPEATASIVRAYLENNLDKTSPMVKFYYMGPMFRRERPQKGRLRQFHHIGCEAIGSQDASIDVEVIALAVALLKGFSIEGYTVKINSLGCLEDKKNLITMLRNGLNDVRENLCQDCQARFSTNVLRILDCKNESCKQIVQGLHLAESYRCPECQAHFDQVISGLESLGIAYAYSPCLVRGLDYYTRTVFEFTHPELGSQQDALGAGGRYDTLVTELGGPVTGAIGFAFGFERLLLVRNVSQGRSSKVTYLITLGDQARKKGVAVLNQLRSAGIVSDTDYEAKSLKGAMRKADDIKARWVLILGENELQKNTVMLKDMATGTQEEVGLDKIVERIGVL